MPQEVNRTTDEAPAFVITRASGQVETNEKQPAPNPVDVAVGFLVLGTLVWGFVKLWKSL